SNTGSWSLFGGHIDGSETAEEALVREIKEEINFDLKQYSLIKETIVEDFGKVFWFHGVIDVPLSNLKLAEGDDFDFFSYKELLKLKISHESKKRLIEYYEGKNK
ncbi:MAG: NUDIX domain-containing protein, partial [bacterium]|nr:NUDIX domain-containing protein [bacterium]